MMVESDGTQPENIPLAEDIREVRKGIKKTARQLQKIDKEPAKGRKALPSGDDGN